MRKKSKIIFLTLVSFFLLALTFAKFDFQKAIQAIKTIPLLTFLLILVLFVVTLIIGAINIWILISKIGKIKCKDVMFEYLISWSAGLITPGRVGEGYLVYALKKRGFEVGQGLSIMLIDKLMTILQLALFTIASVFLFLPSKIATNIVILILIGGLITIAFLYTSKGREFIKKYILRKYSKYFLKFGATNQMMFKEHKASLALNATLTVVRTIIIAVIGYLLFIALGVNIGFIEVFLILNVIQMLSLMPISINGLGVRELSNIYLYGKVGISPSIALSKALVELSLNYIAGVFIFFLFKGQKNQRREIRST